MKKIILSILLTALPCLLLAHSNDDPLKELRKNRVLLSSKQNLFDSLKNTTEKYENLQEQVGYLQKNILILRNLMTKDYPHVTEGMSKYKLDYMEELDDSLKEFRETIKLVKGTIPD